MGHGESQLTAEETGIREAAERIANSAHHSSIKRVHLDNTSGFLNSTPPVALLDEKESIQFVFFNRKEGVEGDFERANHYHPSESRGTLLIITDERVLVLIGEEDTDRAISIPYGVVTGSTYNASLLGSHWLGIAGVSQIDIETTSGTYSVPVIRANREDVKRGSHHIQTYSETVDGGSIREFEPEIDYDSRAERSPRSYKTICACRKCLEEVERDVERCPHCGFSPDANTRGAAWKVGAAGLTMTILAPLGLAMGYDSAKKTHAASKGVWIEKTIELDDQSMQQSPSAEQSAEIESQSHAEEEFSQAEIAQSSEQTPAEKLRELEQLHSEDIITDQEFEEKKAEILSEY